MITRILHKFYIDGFILALPAMVLLGVLIPTSGQSADILRVATKIAIGLVFFIHGMRLSTEQVWTGVRHWRLHLTILAATFVFYPTLGLCLNMLDLLPGELGIGLVYLTLVSSTIQTCISYTAIARGNVGAAVVAAALTNLLGVILTPLLVVAVLATTGKAHVDLNACLAIVTQLLLPFIAGQLIRPRAHGFLRRHDARLKRVDRGLILIVVFSAFSGGTAAGIWSSVPLSQFVLVFVLCVGVFAIGLAVMIAAGRVLGFPRDDRIVIMFVGSSKALGSGLAMAPVLFAGQAVALIILPLMIFHQVKLIAQAFIAQRLSRHPAAEQVPAPAGSSERG